MRIIDIKNISFYSINAIIKGTDPTLHRNVKSTDTKLHHNITDTST